ncbi:NADH-quinone oxidoreductase subunit L [Nostocoides sp. HKS02]|uniref:NADH-quinone oxidoreductase subunit 5 family protein n=1 Tax=Nostocoides sp. HKS02 TaxID=1813880 RepID=UPI0012B470FE|nr:proton-conducting transporter membrane subunit [Tetrasphaera sp. HKS02]QGN58276.1 NADH-quinone oxidoreductase subunit L [Tetrasphaera sp. HKS02]
MSALAARLVILVPAVAALLGLALARRSLRGARLTALVGSGLTLGAALVELVAVHTAGPAATLRTLPGLPVGELHIPLQLQATTAPALVAVVVGIVGGAVQAFAAWYLRDDDRYGVFAATVSLFCAGMLLVVQSADLVLTLVGWEVMGWCSYLLIGHWSRRESARRAALKAFLVTRLADVGFVLGVVLLAAHAGSTAYPAVISSYAGLSPNVPMVLLLLGILGKSGMVPFHDWLPDAMEGPTPASALIHAATMVAAGTFVLAQLFDLLVTADAARWVLALSTAVTMVWAALLAFGQSDLKRLLAYSTLSQVALMLSALAVAPAAEGPGAATLHLYSHAFFKALLFLAVGWLSVTVGGTAATAMRGGVRGHLLLRPALFVGLLSLAGVPPLVGFVSKEHVLAAAEAGSGAAAGQGRAWLVLVAGLLTVALTAAYCTRAWLVLDDLGSADVARHDADSASVGVRVAVAGLALLTVLGGLVVFTPLLRLGGHLGWWMALVSVLLIAGAAVAVRSFSRAGAGDSAQSVDPAVRLVGSRMPLFDNGFGVDRLYLVTVARPVLALARLVVFLDREVIDAYVRGAAVAATVSGRGGQRAHSAERAASGLAWVVAGVVAVALAGVALW